MPSLLAPLALLGVLATLGYGSLRWHSHRLVRDGDPGPQRLRGSIYRGMALFAGFAFVGLLATGSLRLADDALVGLGVAVDGPLGALSWLPILLGTVAVTTVTYLGAFPVAREYRDSTLSTAEAAWVLVRWQLAVLVPALAVFALVPVVGDGGPGALALLLVGIGVTMYLTSPWFVRLSQQTWEPDERAERLDELCERAGVEMGSCHVLSAYDSERAYAVVRGPPGRQTLFVTDYLLDEFDDDTAAALLAAGGARDRRLQQPLLLLGFSGFAAVAVFDLFGGVSGSAGTALLAVALVGFLVVPTVSRWLSYRADDVAAERAGRDALRRALTAVRETQGSADVGRVKGLFRPTPTLDQRLARLGSE